jgi:Arc/MetJ family transcription regulator
MRIEIDIDDQLIAEALEASGLQTIEEMVGEGLRALIKFCNNKTSCCTGNYGEHSPTKDNL